MPALSGHIYVNHDIDCHDVRREIEAMLHDRFAITHTTLQTDHATTDESARATGCTFTSPGAAH
jgi:cobalt-zinc-cadmium efflux system protein